MKKNNKKFIAIYYSFIMFLTLLMGLGTTPVLGAVGLNINWSKDDVPIDNLFHGAISRTGSYVSFYGNNVSEGWSYDVIVYDSTGAYTGGRYTQGGGLYQGSQVSTGWMKNNNRLWVSATASSVVEIEIDEVNSVLNTVSGLSIYEYCEIDFSYNDAIMSVSSIYTPASPDTFHTEIIDMNTISQDYSLNDIGSARCSPDSMEIFGLNDASYGEENRDYVVKYNLQTGVEMDSVNLSTFCINHGVDISGANLSCSSYGRMAVSTDYLYVPCYNNSDTSEYYILRIDVDNLDVGSVYLDNSSLSYRYMQLDVTADDELLIVGYPVSASHNMQMFDIETATQIDTGSDYASPRFSRDGSAVFVTDSTDDYIYYYDTDYEVDLGAGQDEGEDSGDYLKTCNDFGSPTGYISIEAPYLEHYIKSFGDVTINQVELFISRDQFEYVGSNPTDYFMYFNGINQGGANLIYQYDSNQYIVKWEGIDLDISTHNIVMEFYCDNALLSPPDYEYYWYRLPYADDEFYSTAHSNSSNYGDGYQQGNAFPYGDTSIKYCLYYTPNTIEGYNTYDITMYSVDPHYQGNTTVFNVDVTGDNDWYAIWRSPSDLLFKRNYFDGNDAVCSYTLPLDAEVGEWKFYAIDDDLWGYPSFGLDTYGTNITFNVSDGSSFWGDWKISPFYESVTLGEFNGFHYLVPDGESFLIRVSLPDGSSYTDVDGVGTGEIRTSSLFINCMQVGTWHLTLYNTSGSDDVFEDDAVFTVTSSTTNQNLLNILGSKTICAGNSLHFTGYFVGNLGNIHIIYDEDHIYNIVVTTGTINKVFTIPNGLYGDWEAYLTDSSGNRIADTTIEFTSINCDGTGGDGDGDGDGDFNGDDPSDWYDDVMPSGYKPYIGMLIIGIFLVLPLIISSNYGIDMPMIGYTGFAFTGLGISIALGFFQMWIALLVIVGIVATAVIVAFIRR